PPPTPFPYTTLFRSLPDHRLEGQVLGFHPLLGITGIPGQSWRKTLTSQQKSTAILSGDRRIAHQVYPVRITALVQVHAARVQHRSEEHTSELQSREN